jgi:hypothetical protein
VIYFLVRLILCNVLKYFSTEVFVPLTPKQRRFMLALQARLASNPDIAPSYEELLKDIGELVDRGVLVLAVNHRPI